MAVEINDANLSQCAGASWCEDEAVLHDIYTFSHRSCSNSQSTGRIVDISIIFTKFVNDLKASVSWKIDFNAGGVAPGAGPA